MTSQDKVDAKELEDTKQRQDIQRAEVDAPQVDRVAVPSLKADGTPDQTPGFERLVDEEPEDRVAADESTDAGKKSR